MPRSPRVFVCTCEDVTRAEIEACLQKGQRDVESVKRYTGFGTGMCQGRYCLARVAALLHRAGVPAGDLVPISPRPPLEPLALGDLATLSDVTAEDEDGP